MRDIVDRSACSASRHGSVNDYRRGCRCPDACEARRLYVKRIKVGRALPGYVSSVGTGRRVRALAALGWSAADVGQHLGLHRNTIAQLGNDRRATILRSTAARIAAVYDELQGTPGPSVRARNFARKAGWPPPHLWDDIDDPDARPVDDAPVSMGKYRVDLDEIDFLMSQGYPLAKAAERCGVREDSVRTAMRRREQRQDAAA